MELLRKDVLKFTSLTPIPEKFTMVNELSSAKGSKSKDNCQMGFTYFKHGKNTSPYWCSSRPIKEACPSNFEPHPGTPSHSLWNNMTKRKSVVEK